MSTDLSFADLYSLSIATQKGVQDLFASSLRVGFSRSRALVEAGLLAPGEVKLSIELNRRCSFLDGTSCTVHSVDTVAGPVGRPLACGLFPEALTWHRHFDLEDEVAASMERNVDFYRQPFPCVDPVPMKEERAGTVYGLQSLLHQEFLLTEALLFGRSPFALDVQPLLVQLEASERVAVEGLLHNSSDLTVAALDDLGLATQALRSRLETHWPEVVADLRTGLQKIEENPRVFSDSLTQLGDDLVALQYGVTRSDLIERGLIPAEWFPDDAPPTNEDREAEESGEE